MLQEKLCKIPTAQFLQVKFISHLSYKSNEFKALALSSHFHSLKWSLLRNMLSKFSTNSKGTFNSIMHSHWQMEDDVEPVLRELKRCSVVKGNILWTVRWPAILHLHYPSKEKVLTHQDNTIKLTVREEWRDGGGSLPELLLTKGLVHNWMN